MTESNQRQVVGDGAIGLQANEGIHVENIYISVDEKESSTLRQLLSELIANSAVAFNKESAFQQFKTKWDFCEPCNKLELDQLIPLIKFGSQTFNLSYYQKRAIDQQLIDAFASGKDIILYGVAGIGKSRAAFEFLRELSDFWVIIPPRTGVRLNDIPSWEESNSLSVVVFFDDLDTFSNTANPTQVELDLRRKNIKNIRSLATVQEEMLTVVEKTFSKFFSQSLKIEIKRFNDSESATFIQELGCTFDDNHPEFTDIGVPGKVLLEINDLESKYISMTAPIKAIFHACKLLISVGLRRLSSEVVRIVCKTVFGQSHDIHSFNEAIDSFVDVGLLKRIPKDIVSHESYYIKVSGLFIEKLVTYIPQNEDFILLEDILTDSESLFYLGTMYLEAQKITHATKIFEKSIVAGPSDFENWYNLAVCYEKQKMIPESIKAYEKCLELNPGFQSAKNNLAAIYLENEQLEKAFHLLSAVLNNGASQTNLHTNMGVYYFSSGKLEEALQHYEQALGLDPENKNTLNNIGLLYEVSGDLDKAISFYERAIQQDITFSEAHYNKGNANYKKSDYDSALKNYQDALIHRDNYFEALGNIAITYERLENYDLAKEYHKKSLAIKPDYHKSYTNLTAIYFSQQMFDEAKTSCLEYLDHEKNDKYLSEAWNNLGYAYSQTGNIVQAFDAFKAAYLHDSLNISAVKNYTLALHNLNKFDEAYPILLESEKQFPSDSELLRSFAYNLHMRGEHFESVRYYRKSLAIEENKMAYYNLAILLKEENQEESKALLKKALSLDNNFFEALVELGIFFAKSNNLDDAIPLFEKASQVNHANSIGWENLGLAYMGKDRFPDAINAFNEAKNLSPKYSIYFNLGNAYFMNNEYELALEHFREALKLDDTASTLWHHTGLTYFKLSNYLDAYKSFVQAINRGRNYLSFYFAGVTSVELGEPHRALDYYITAVSICNSDPVLWISKAVAHSHIGEKQESLKDLKCAFKLDYSQTDLIKQLLDMDPAFLLNIREDDEFKALLNSEKLNGEESL